MLVTATDLLPTIYYHSNFGTIVLQLCFSIGNKESDSGTLVDPPSCFSIPTGQRVGTRGELYNWITQAGGKWLGAQKFL